MTLKSHTFEYDDAPPLKNGTDLAFEEAVLTNVSPVQGSYESTRTAAHAWWVLSLLGVVTLLLLGRLAYLQIGKGSSLRAMAEGNRLRERLILAPRGEIVDRNNEVLARSKASFRLVVTPLDVPQDQIRSVVHSVAVVLSLDESVLVDALKKFNPRSVQPLVLYANLTTDQAVLFETRALEFPGLSVETIPIREYTSSESFAHVLGTTGSISEDDPHLHMPGYFSADVVGKAGIESTYETPLKGVNGQNLVEVDAAGTVVKSLGQIPSSPGNTVGTTLDKGLQEEIYAQFKNRPNSKGAAIALNPKTGEVLALVSYPGFDTNLFSEGIKNEDYQKLLQDPLLPLFNRAVSAQLPPGSTVKMMVALAALEEKVITDRTVITDSGKITIPNQFNPSVVYDYVGWKRTGLGPLTVRSAIAQSSDIFFYIVGGGYTAVHIDGLGVNKLAEYYRKFNLGKKTGIDIPGEKNGLVADPDWKKQYYEDNAVLGKWYLGDTYHVSIGQGDMLVTPLQMALWTSIIANNGVGMKPHVMLKVTNTEGKIVATSQPQVLVSKIGSDANIKVVQEGMRETVLSGTAKKLQSLPISSAGKTGTAQFDNNESEHSWFTSYAPYEDPQIVVTVLVEGGGEGGAAALPIAQHALNWWAVNRYKR